MYSQVTLMKSAQYMLSAGNRCRLIMCYWEKMGSNIDIAGELRHHKAAIEGERYLQRAILMSL
jgi:hypothetical protein